jgi:hypothetical protein
MDSKGVTLKTVLTFENVFLLNNFDISESSLDIIADNRQLSFSVSTPPDSFVLARNWIIKSSVLGQVELVNVANVLGRDSDIMSSRNDIFQDSAMGFNEMLKQQDSKEISRKFVLDNLGLIISTSLYNKEYLSILCRTDRTFRVLYFRLSQVEELMLKNQKNNGGGKKYWDEEDKSAYSDDSEEEDDSEETKTINLEQIVRHIKGRELQDADTILSLGETLLAVYGKVVKLLDLELNILKSWILESPVECIKEIITLKGSEVGWQYGLIKGVPARTQQWNDYKTQCKS